MHIGEKSYDGDLIGIDVGGTFTDLVRLDQTSGAVRLAKVPTTLDNQARGVIAAHDEAGADLSRVGLIVHGTTTTTNAVLEGFCESSATGYAKSECPFSIVDKVQLPVDLQPGRVREDACWGANLNLLRHLAHLTLHRRADLRRDELGLDGLQRAHHTQA